MFDRIVASQSSSAGRFPAGSKRPRDCRGRDACLQLAVAGLTLSLATPASAEEGVGKPFCKRAFTRESAFRSPASQDLYNALLWMGGTGAIHLSTTPDARWTDTNSFDRGIRSGLRIDSASGRDAAATASDVMLSVSAGLLPLAAIGKTWSQGDCHEAYDMATDALEALALTLFITEVTKVISGRERPYLQECGPTSSGSFCGDSDRNKSFFSGHASIAAMGAGLSCSYAIRRETWGESTAARVVPCALGVAAAIAAGFLRAASDRHWGTDALVGWTVGAMVGYFDTWGPFDLLRFEVESDRHAFGMRGVVLPYAGDGAIGARLAIVF